MEQHAPESTAAVEILCRAGEDDLYDDLYGLPDSPIGDTLARLFLNEGRFWEKQIGTTGFAVRMDGRSAQLTDPRYPIKDAFLGGFSSTIPLIVHDVVLAIVSSGATLAAAYPILNAWVNARNGRKIRIKVGDVEVEATQMKESDVLRIFELLQEKANQQKIRDLLLDASKGQRPISR